MSCFCRNTVLETAVGVVGGKRNKTPVPNPVVKRKAIIIIKDDSQASQSQIAYPLSSDRTVGAKGKLGISSDLSLDRNDPSPSSFQEKPQIKEEQGKSQNINRNDGQSQKESVSKGRLNLKKSKGKTPLEGSHDNKHSESFNQDSRPRKTHKKSESNSTFLGESPKKITFGESEAPQECGCIKLLKMNRRERVMIVKTPQKVLANEDHPSSGFSEFEEGLGANRIDVGEKKDLPIQIFNSPNSISKMSISFGPNHPSQRFFVCFSDAIEEEFDHSQGNSHQFPETPQFPSKHLIIETQKSR